MNLPVSLHVSLRYLRGRTEHRFISFISAVSVLGIALGLTAVITVVSVMNGFQHEIRDRMLAMLAHVTVLDGTSARLDDWHSLADRLEEHPRVLAAAPFIEGEGMLSIRSAVRGAGIRGVLPQRERDTTHLGEKIEVGSLDTLVPGEYRILLGEGLALSLGAGIGDAVTLVVPRASHTVLGITPKFRRFTVAGIFRFDMSRYDSHLAFVHLDDAAAVFGFGNAVSGLRLRTPDPLHAPWIAQRLAQDLVPDHRIYAWSDLHANFFRALQMEKTMLFLLLMLIVVVAAFNIVSALLMTVLEKRGDIAVLRTLGMTRRGILSVFLLQGLVIGVVGTVLGVAGGMALTAHLQQVVSGIETLLGFQAFSPEIYYLGEIPVRLDGMDVSWSAAVALLLSLAAAWYPAMRALRVAPAEVLRHE